MANTFISRLRAAWNVFSSRNELTSPVQDRGMSTTSPLPYRHHMRWGTEQSIVNSIYTRCAIDVSNLKFRHARVDKNESFIEVIDSGFNKCLSLSANLDQGHEAFLQDVVISMFDEGAVAIVPVDTTISLSDNSFDILSLRTGRIKEWYPQDIRVEVYNDATGKQEELMLPKEKVGIVENPFFSLMNQYNSTLQRLIRTLNYLDVIGEQSSSGKLDIIIQLPYAVKGETRQKQAEERRTNLEAQLKNSKYGVAYSDATENIVQLNRAAENNLLTQVEYLTRMLYGQLGISENILNGTATEQEFLNYFNRTIEPIGSAIANEMKRKFLTQTAISQGQSVLYFRDMFGVVTAANLAELSDKLTRNEILTGNEFRAIMGYKPVDDPNANRLRNKNLNDPSVNNQSETSSLEDLSLSPVDNSVSNNKGV